MLDYNILTDETKPVFTAQVASLADDLKELKPLFPIHYAEISEHMGHGIELNPNYNFFLAKEKAGELLYVSLRRDGLIEGYFIGFFGLCLHYQVPTLKMDIIYVTPDARGNKGGMTLMKAVAAEFHRRKGRLWVMGLKEAHAKYMEEMLLKSGFAPFERSLALWAGE